MMKILQSLPDLYVFDIDGTSALTEHREHFLHDQALTEAERWRSFFAACKDDLPNLPVLKTLRRLRASGAECRFFSGRSDEVLELTIQWLMVFTDFTEEELRTPGVLTMRPAEDHSDDATLKARWYDELPDADKQRLVAVFDDRQKVVNMWRARGVPCFQVAPGDF